MSELKLDMHEKFLIETEEGMISDCMYSGLSNIKIPQLFDFTVICLNVYGTEEKLVEANKVVHAAFQLLKKKKLIDDQTHQSFVDVLTSAALLHNIFYNEEDFTTLFKARKQLMPLAESMAIPAQVTDTIFQTIEAQLGDSTPVPLCKPPVNSPTELFALAVWVVKEFQAEV
jgi:hypothetical protein